MGYLTSAKTRLEEYAKGHNIDYLASAIDMIITHLEMQFRINARKDLQKFRGTFTEEFLTDVLHLKEGEGYTPTPSDERFEDFPPLIINPEKLNESKEK